MKARIVCVEVEGESLDLSDILSRLLPSETETVVSLPAPAAQQPDPEPPRTQLAPLPREWRPRAKRSSGNAGIAARTERAEAASARNLRPSAAAKRICAGCGEDRPAGLHHRAKCPKCGTIASEPCPRRGALPAAVGGE